MQDVRSLIHQAHTENWEELDLSGMNLTKLPPEIACLTGLRSLSLGKSSDTQGCGVIVKTVITPESGP